MVAPLLAAGARVALSGGARATATKSAGRGISGARMETAGTRPGVQNTIKNKIRNKRFEQSDQIDREEEAEEVNSSPYIQNARAIGSADSRYPTIAESLQQKTAGYSSVARTRDARLQNKKQSIGQEESNISIALPSNLNQPQTRGIGKATQNVKKIKKVVKTTIKIARIITTIMVVSSPFLILIVIAWLLSLAGIGLETAIYYSLSWMPLVGEWVAEMATWGIPGEYLFGLGYILVFMSGLITLGMTVALLFVSRIPWAQSKFGVISLAAAVALYATPVLQIFPWFIFFLFLVWVSRVSDPG